MNKTSVILTAVLAAVLIVGALIGGYFAGRGKRPEIQTEIQRDTVWRTDTVTQYKPEYITKTVIRRELVEVTDTVTINDTTYISLPVERKEYRDSNYFAVVTGIRPELEKISVFPKTQIITETITQTIEVPVKSPKPWGVGIQAGFGGFYGISGKRVDYGPYIGVGISYNIFRW